ncbi:MAG: HlyD family efflux transporter periplasmic adaptor subunit [Pirellulaceae bacterium]|nr:HlyD family efflux transporter periplasmic adaptor subunit [Pirellulaceae bacterium]
MKFTLKTLIWGTLLVAVGLVASFALFPKPVEVEVARATLGPLRVTVQEDGKTRIREKYIVSAPVAGRVSRIELKPGDRCNVDTLLAVILPSEPAILDARSRAEAAARVQAAEATRLRAASSEEQAKIDHALNQSKLERAQALLPTQAISQDEYDVIKAQTQASAQAIKTARFDVEISQYELEMAQAAAKQFSRDDEQSSAAPFEIFAPISGKVLRVFEESSKVVAVGQPLLEVGDPQNLEIEIDLLSTDAVRVRPGAELTIEHWGGDTPLAGNVRVIEPAAFTKISSLGVEEQRVNIIADINEPPERIASLGDGYRIEARITVDQLAQALLIPNSALFRHNRQWHVLAVVDGRAELRQVSIGLQNESHTQIVNGIEADEPVIVYPSDTLKPGTSVSFTR